MLSTQNNTTTPINIAVLDVSSQNRAVLGFFFESSGTELFKEVGIDQASAFIIDFDFPGAIESWEEISLTTQKPGIVLSINEIIMPNTIWVKKPLTAKLLTDAGIKIHEMLDAHEDQTVAPSPVLETISLSEQQPAVSEHNLAEMPAFETEALAESPAVAKVEGVTSNLALAAVATSSLLATSDDLPLAPIKDLHASNSDSINIEPIELQDEDELDEIDTLLHSLNTENEARQEIKTIGNEDISVEIDALVETEATLKAAANIEFTSDIEELSADAESVAIEEEPNQETNAKFFDELVLETAPEETHDTQEVREDIITSENNTETDDGTTEISSSLDGEVEKSQDVASDEDSADSDLQAMLDEIQQEMEGHNTGSNASIGGGSENSQNTQQEYKTTNAQERWALLCGDKNHIKSTSEIKKDIFKLNDHLLANLLETIEEAKITQQVMRIKYEDALIIIDTKIDTVYTDMSIYSEEYAKICFEPIEHDALKVHSLDSSEIRMVHKKIESEPKNSYSIESFIWTTSLLTSRGRLLEHTNTNKVVGLKHWPNLTRIENFPHVMNIAAVFSKHPGNLLDISKWLNIPQCYVFAFYNAAFSLNMIDLDSDVLNKNNIKKVSFSFAKKGKSENRGLFSRLLNKIKG